MGATYDEGARYRLASMKIRRLGSSGLNVSELGFGTTTLGEAVDGDDAIALVRHAISAGVTYFDTAVTYSGGRSEELLGKAIAGCRDDVVIGTKVGLRAPGEGEHTAGLSRRRIMQAIEISLSRLGTDHVDLYMAHRPDSATPIEETLEAMDRLVRDGKVRYIGAPNYAAWQMAQAHGVAERRDLARWVCAQNKWNLIDGIDDASLLPASRELGFGLIPYQPLASSVLAGKYRRGEEPPKGTRAGDFQRFRGDVTDARIAAVERVRPWAQERGHSTADLAIAWLLAHPETSTVIVGIRSKEQLDQNARATEWRLTGAERDAVSALARPPAV
jgi:aryl-alcohol dehydrogenase-like predicted oxidoreductase